MTTVPQTLRVRVTSKEPLALDIVSFKLVSFGDGVVTDMLRMQQVLNISHKWEQDSPQSMTPRYAAAVYFVGKNAKQYKKGRHLASQFVPFAERTVSTTVGHIRKGVDASRYDLLVKKARVGDSAKEGPPDPELVGTADEETVSGSEQFTYCVVCVLSKSVAPVQHDPASQGKPMNLQR
jgi:hypothetical protein